MPTTRAQSRRTSTTSRTHGPTSSRLLQVPAEIRFQVYEWLLPAQGFLCDNEHASLALSGLSTEELEEADDGPTFDSLETELTVRNPANPQQPSYEDRTTFSKLLLVCKSVHAEAAPLFFSRVTFFISRYDPFDFANKFLRKLADDKISSLRHLELKLPSVETRCLPRNIAMVAIELPDHPYAAKLLYRLKRVFEMYKELHGLESFTLTLTSHGRAYQLDGQPSLIFRPASDDNRVMVWEQWTRNWMWKTALALLKTMRVPDFELSKSVEDVYERVAPNHRRVAWRGRVFRVKLQRKH